MVLAVSRRVLHRLRHGPAVPGWTWEVELKAVAMRTFIETAIRLDDRVTRQHLEARLDPPLPRWLRGVLDVRTVVLGGRPAEWIERRDPRGDLSDVATVLYLHGGGYVAGSRSTHRHFTSRLTWALHARTVAVDYRLAPRHPFPAALDDATAAYAALVEGTDVQPERLFLAGDSAGGGLALALLLRLRDQGMPLPAGAILFSPYTDLAHTGPSIFRNVATDYLPSGGPVRPNVEYLGRADPTDPGASPLYGDLAGLPPLLVFAGGREMILDDSLRLAERATAAGVEVDLHVAPDMYHVWPAVVPDHPDSLRALAVCAEFVARHAAAPTGRP
jgi:epsilon-lactone hydrolase